MWASPELYPSPGFWFPAETLLSGALILTGSHEMQMCSQPKVQDLALQRVILCLLFCSHKPEFHTESLAPGWWPRIPGRPPGPGGRFSTEVGCFGKFSGTRRTTGQSEGNFFRAEEKRQKGVCTLRLGPRGAWWRQARVGEEKAAGVRRSWGSMGGWADKLLRLSQLGLEAFLFQEDTGRTCCPGSKIKGSVARRWFRAWELVQRWSTRDALGL